MSETRKAGTTMDSKLQLFFIDQLKDLYWAEKKLVKTLPKMEEASTTEDLKQAFGSHLEQTMTHVSRLENVFDILGEQPKAVKCQAMVGIVSEGEDIIDETDKGTAQRDVGLIFAGQKAEHYEIATYGGMVSLAETLGYPEISQLLRETLMEEKEADATLSRIATGNVNRLASMEPSDSNR